ncbi:tol-pal system protein YbgF [Nitrosovibrio sp. Nv6]|nr:tol-pal system protein YbgF [Nitrosovibrio sp. Nv6]
MQLRAFWLLFLICCNPGYAGVFDDEEARRKIAEQQAVIRDVRDQGQILEGRVVKLEEVLNNQPLLELHSQIEALRLDLNKLQGQIEVLVNENELTQKRQKDFYIDLDNRLRRIEQPDEPVTSGAAASGPIASESATPESAASQASGSDDRPEPDVEVASAAAVVVPPAPGMSAPSMPAAGRPAPNTGAMSGDGAEGRAYEAAYDLFKGARYKDAISRFEKFIKNYPASNLAPSAQYWIGNSHYALRDFKSAVNAQEKLIKTFPDSAKAPDAMLNIASSQQEMSRKTDARKTLQTLVAKYPGSEAAEKAKQRLVNLK